MSIDVAPRVLLSKRQAAELLGVSTQTLDRWRRRGVIKPVQVIARGRVRFRADDVEALLEPELRGPAPAKEEELEWD